MKWLFKQPNGLKVSIIYIEQSPEMCVGVDKHRNTIFEIKIMENEPRIHG